MTDAPYTYRDSRVEVTEDGDIVYERTVTAKEFDGAREYIKYAKENGKSQPKFWTCVNGCWEGRFYFNVDGAQDAIERSNDYHAFLRDQGTPDA